MDVLALLPDDPSSGNEGPKPFVGSLFTGSKRSTNHGPGVPVGPGIGDGLA
jgi:hypothetical protein